MQILETKISVIKNKKILEKKENICHNKIDAGII